MVIKISLNSGSFFRSCKVQVVFIGQKRSYGDISLNSSSFLDPLGVVIVDRANHEDM